LATPSAWSGNAIDNIRLLDQAMFKQLTDRLGANIGYKAITPGTPLDGLGFDLEARAGQDTDLTEPAPLGDVGRYLPQLGGNSPVQVSGFYSSVPFTDITLVGGEVNYSLIEDRPLGGPALSLRGTYTRLEGVQDLGLQTRGLELSVSKDFSAVTPYAGLGRTWIDGETSVEGLANESLTRNKYFMGVNIRLGSMSFAAEAEQSGDSVTTNAKFGVRF
jgi:hypothetical protein